MGLPYLLVEGIKTEINLYHLFLQHENRLIFINSLKMTVNKVKNHLIQPGEIGLLLSNISPDTHSDDGNDWLEAFQPYHQRAPPQT